MQRQLSTDDLYDHHYEILGRLAELINPEIQKISKLMLGSGSYDDFSTYFYKTMEKIKQEQILTQPFIEDLEKTLNLAIIFINTAANAFIGSYPIKPGEAEKIIPPEEIKWVADQIQMTNFSSSAFRDTIPKAWNNPQLTIENIPKEELTMTWGHIQTLNKLLAVLQKEMDVIKEEVKSLAFQSTINFNSLTQEAKITGGAHAAGLAPRSEKYLKESTNEVFYVKQDAAEKNIIEWVFYHYASRFFAKLGISDFNDRLAKIYFVFDETKIGENEKYNSASLYIGSLECKGKVAWLDVYTQYWPTYKIPEKRPGAFEWTNLSTIKDYISAFNDPGFALIPVFEVLGLYSHQFGNLIIKEGVNKKLAFIDYAAAAWYDIKNENFDQPNIRGTRADYYISYAGINKQYSVMYGDIIYKIHAQKGLQLLEKVFHIFTDADGKEILRSMFREVIYQLNQIIDQSSLEQFWKYVACGTQIINNLSIYESLIDHLTESLYGRIQHIPTFIQKITARITMLDEVESSKMNELVEYRR